MCTGVKKDALKIIKKFGDINYKSLGIKFQPFKYDLIALENFSWYDVYKELFFNEKDWLEILQKSSEHFKFIWLDLFDLYGVSILEKNISLIHGIKIQASVINNKEVYNALKKVNLKKKIIIINISGYRLEKINDILNNFSDLEPKEIVLQIGFQSYPTKISDSSLNKIKTLKDMFPDYRVCFADHVSAVDDFSENFLSSQLPKAVK